MSHLSKKIQNKAGTANKTLSPALRNLIRLMAQLAAEQHLSELRAAKRIAPKPNNQTNNGDSNEKSETNTHA